MSQEALMFPSFRSKRLRRKPVEPGTSEVVDLEAYRPWPMPPATAEKIRAPTSLPVGPTVQAANLARRLEGTWPNLSYFIEKTLKEKLENGRLDFAQAERLVVAIEARLTLLSLQDVPEERIAQVVYGGGEMLDGLDKPGLRQDRYNSSFRERCLRHLRFGASTPEAFECEDLWKRGYKQLILMVFLCVEPQLEAQEQTAQKSTKK